MLASFLFTFDAIRLSCNSHAFLLTLLASFGVLLVDGFDLAQDLREDVTAFLARREHIGVTVQEDNRCLPRNRLLFLDPLIVIWQLVDIVELLLKGLIVEVLLDDLISLHFGFFNDLVLTLGGLLICASWMRLSEILGLNMLIESQLLLRVLMVCRRVAHRVNRQVLPVCIALPLLVNVD